MTQDKSKQRSKQRGGTLLGFILGALVGLGAALAVAVYITKVPIPFMNKTLPRSADSDAAESRKNRDWDPNSGLAGKQPAVRPTPPASSVVAPAPDPVTAPPALKPATPAAPAAPSVSSLPATPAAPAAPAVKPPAEKPAPSSGSAASADPLGDLANARAKTAAAAAGGADLFSYFIQVGAFRTPEDAEQQRAKISMMGLQAKVSEREQSGRTVYRVRLGPFDKKDEADKAKDRLDANGVETAIVRVQK